MRKEKKIACAKVEKKKRTEKEKKGKKERKKP